MPATIPAVLLVPGVSAASLVVAAVVGATAAAAAPTVTGAVVATMTGTTGPGRAAARRPVVARGTSMVVGSRSRAGSSRAGAVGVGTWVTSRPDHGPAASDRPAVGVEQDCGRGHPDRDLFGESRAADQQDRRRGRREERGSSDDGECSHVSRVRQRPLQDQ
jgi:hypothetical protein